MKEQWKHLLSLVMAFGMILTMGFGAGAAGTSEVMFHAVWTELSEVPDDGPTDSIPDDSDDPVFPGSEICGDIDGDGEVTPADSILFGQYFAGWPAEIVWENADLNGDGDVTRADAMYLARALNNWAGYELLY